jgi:outer membrane receptor protein involved in Fe transport
LVRWVAAVRRWLVPAILGALVAIPAAAQSGGIRVVVVSPDGKTPVAGVAVSLSNTQGFVAPTVARTGADGVADFPVLRAGPGYALDVSHPGQVRMRFVNVDVRIGKTTEISVRLAPEINERVVVVDRKERLDLDKTATSTRFGKEFIADLPNAGRFYQSLLALAPGVQDPNGDGNPNVHGARDVDFRTEVGGVSNQDPLTGGWMSYINPDSIEEVEVLTTGAGVEFGRAQGGFASIIQKQGSNDLEGVFHFLFRSGLFDGKSSVASAGAEAPDYTWTQPAIQLSGPLVRDRVWFRISHEAIRREEPIDTLAYVAVTSRRQTINSDQITWQVSPRNKLAFEFRSDPLTLRNAGTGKLTPPESSARIEHGGPTYVLTWTTPVSARMLVDTTVSHQQGRQAMLPSSKGVSNDCLAGFVDPLREFSYFPTLEKVRCLDLRSGRRSGSAATEIRDSRERFTVRSQASVHVGRLWGADHQLKVGLSVENERYFRKLRQGPEVNFDVVMVDSVDDTGKPRRLEIATASVQVAAPNELQTRAVGDSLAFFIEDQLKPASNLSLTLGLRVDREAIRGRGYAPFDPAAESAEYVREAAGMSPTAQNALIERTFTAFGDLQPILDSIGEALDIPSEYIDDFVSPMLLASQSWIHRRRPEDIDIVNTNVSPRFAVSWDPFGDGRTKLSLTAGRYYGLIFLAVPLVEAGPATTLTEFTATRWRGEEFWGNVGLVSGLSPAARVQEIDHALRTPYQDEWAVTFEREILPETRLRLAWISRRYRDQLQDEEVNHHTADFGRCVAQRWPTDPWIDTTAPDGLLDDCDGGLLRTEGAPPSHPPGSVRRPDGYLDAYIYNPGWGEIYRVGNQNEADYQAATLEILRRFHRGWQLDASYTWSRAIGDAEDFTSRLGNDPTLVDSERGYLAYDRRHVVKVSATTITPWGFRLGGTANWSSGLPYSIIDYDSTMDSVPPHFLGNFASGGQIRIRYPTHRRNDRRNLPTLALDVKIEKEWKAGRSAQIGTSLEIYNLLSDRKYTIYNSATGFGQQVNGQNDAYRTPGRQYQLGLRVAF